MFCQQNHNIRIASKAFWNVVGVKCWRTTLTNQKHMREELRAYWTQELPATLFPFLLSKM
jgi:hypothetical protein